ncbi:transcription initiation factor iie, alpha subunit, putative [Ricinus communis]|uniref:Transcription initiation factor iie, alpha subunit, putative n=1 Tax=Ricinus communis TaxID=3988 RepID=B9T7B4_RICCO|nr:transcription initiation factor iie, alpha subunit, putative [Ricinus communis]
MDVEVAFSGVGGKEEDVKPETEGSGLKVLPPWMIKQGMNLTKEQRGEVVKQESKMDGSSAAPEFSDDKKAINNGDSATQYQDEYAKAYYAALFKRQQELEEAAKKQESSHTPISNGVTELSSNRQVGMKSKREEDEGEDEIEWEESTTGGNATESYKVNDLNVEAEASGDEEDDIDWEEG